MGKLKDKPLDYWTGRVFRSWARIDVNDETKINYILNWFSIGDGWAVYTFTSDDLVDGHMQYMISNSAIHEIRKDRGEWFVVLDYPFYYQHPENDAAVLKTRHECSI